MSDGGFGGGDFARTPSAASDPDLSLYRGGSMGHASMSFHTDDQLDYGGHEENGTGMRRRRHRFSSDNVAGQEHTGMRIERTASRLLEAFKDKSNKSPKAGLTHSDTEADLEALAKIVQRRETFLDAMEIWPDGAHRANKVTRSYILNLAKSAGAPPTDTKSNMRPDESSTKEIRRALRQQLGNALQHRDFRQIDPAFSGKPAIWVRSNAIVVSLDEVRALILYNRCFVFNYSALTTAQLDTIYSRISEAKEDSQEIDETNPFEFCALEGLLLALTSRLEKTYNDLEVEILDWTAKLTTLWYQSVLEGFRTKNSDLNQMLSRIKHTKTVLDDLLDCDEDMANMYLTEIHNNYGHVRNALDHESVEMLLENYLQIIDFLYSRGQLLSTSVQDAENLVEMRLDELQNRLLLVELFIDSLSLVFGVGTLVFGVFGMNMRLPPSISELPASQFYFVGVTVITVFFMVLVPIVVVYWLAVEGIWSFNNRSSRAPRKQRIRDLIQTRMTGKSTRTISGLPVRPIHPHTN